MVLLAISEIWGGPYLSFEKFWWNMSLQNYVITEELLKEIVLHVFASCFSCSSGAWCPVASCPLKWAKDIGLLSEELTCGDQSLNIQVRWCNTSCLFGAVQTIVTLHFVTPSLHLLSEGHSSALQPLVVSWPIAWYTWGFCGRGSLVKISDGSLGTKLPYSCRNKWCYFSSLLLLFLLL